MGSSKELMRWQGCLMGLAVGDALGTTLEFTPKAQVGPIDDIVEKRIIEERRVLPYQPLREADIFWEKRIWRVIDIREKMNLPFAYTEKPFFTILMDAAVNNEITVYSTEDDKFTNRLQPDEVAVPGRDACACQRLPRGVCFRIGHP